MYRKAFEISFVEEVLGTASANPEVYAKFIQAKGVEARKKAGIPEDEGEALAAEELEALPDPEEQIELSTTVFPRGLDGEPMLWDYQVKGFFKNAMLALLTSGIYTQEELKKVRLTLYSYKKTIDLHLFIFPRRIPLILPEGGEITHVERPLRAETMRGERIALARSEAVPASTTIHIEVGCMNTKLWPFIESCLDYGMLSGIGQWRNSGKGRFTYVPE